MRFCMHPIGTPRAELSRPIRGRVALLRLFCDFECPHQGISGQLYVSVEAKEEVADDLCCALER